MLESRKILPHRAEGTLEGVRSRKKEKIHSHETAREPVPEAFWWTLLLNNVSLLEAQSALFVCSPH